MKKLYIHLKTENTELSGSLFLELDEKGNIIVNHNEPTSTQDLLTVAGILLSVTKQFIKELKVKL